MRVLAINVGSVRETYQRSMQDEEGYFVDPDEERIQQNEEGNWFGSVAVDRTERAATTVAHPTAVQHPLLMGSGEEIWPGCRSRVPLAAPSYTTPHFRGFYFCRPGALARADKRSIGVQ